MVCIANCVESFVFKKLLLVGMKKMLENMRNKLKNKKTYLVGISAIIGAVIAWLNNAIDTNKLIELVVEAILAMTLRAGIAKVDNSLKVQ